MPRWTWQAEVREPGRTIVVDIDGVVSNAWHRQHFLEGPKKRWQDFFAAATGDEPLLPAITLLDLIDDETQITLLTARPESIHDQTVEWLREYDIRWDLLVMRSRADHGPAPELKRLAIAELRSAGYEPVLAIDDDDRIIAVYAEEDVPALYIHSGYYG